MNYSRLNKKIAGLTIAAMLSTAAAFAAEPAPGIQILKYDRPEAVSEMPENFRTAQSPYLADRVAKAGYTPSREGLDNLRQSGSSFFSKNEFKELLKHVPAKDLVVIDLRNESHGYINNTGISWYSKYKTFNKGQSVKEIDRREKGMLETALMNKQVPIAKLDKTKSIASQTDVDVKSVETEEQFVKSMGVKYYRVPVMDYSAPTPQNVDDFLAIYKKLPKNAWVHVHCEAGVGRTTIFLSLMDMIKNADKVSYDDIMTREVLLGGQDVRKSAETTKDAYKKVNYPKRALFTRHFYEYVKANPQLKKTYTQWTKENGYEF